MKFTHAFTKSEIINSTRGYLWLKYYRRLSIILTIAVILLSVFSFYYIDLMVPSIVFVSVILMFLTLTYRNWISGRLRMNEMLKGEPIKYEFSDKGIVVNSKLGLTTIEWINFIQIHRNREWIFLEYVGNGFISLPITIFNGELNNVLTFIRNKNPQIVSSN